MRGSACTAVLQSRTGREDGAGTGWAGCYLLLLLLLPLLTAVTAAVGCTMTESSWGHPESTESRIESVCLSGRRPNFEAEKPWGLIKKAKACKESKFPSVAHVTLNAHAAHAVITAACLISFFSQRTVPEEWSCGD